MKFRNVLLGAMLGLNVMTAYGAVATGAATAAIVATNTAVMSATASTIANTVSANMMNSNNSVVIECRLEKETVKAEGEWFGRSIPSLKETIKESDCQWNKKAMEQLNNTRYEFGKARGIFYAGGVNHVMIELVEVK